MTSARYSQAMTDLSRGARVRRGGRRPGWLLLTALLVLAIGASSALVFTNRVELLKLAVILALWAAVVAAFVSVIYRRQSDVDQARVRDLKLVYDLQLDREISARREYELTVESQLRRELASELRGQAADEVAALRSELAALRTNLEILFETELDQRPALETERTTVRGYSEWANTGDNTAADWVSPNRVTSVRAETTFGRTEESSIIDVPEEPVPRPPVVDTAAPYLAADAYRPPEEFQSAEAFQAAEPYPAPEDYRGSHWRPAEGDGGRPVEEQYESRHGRHTPEAPLPPPEPRPEYRDAPPASPEPQRADWHPPPAAESPEPCDPAAAEWRTVGAEGGWAPAESPGGDWVSVNQEDFADAESTANGAASSQPPPETPVLSRRRSRHASPPESEPELGGPFEATEQPAPSRHSAGGPDCNDGVGVPSPPPQPVAEPSGPPSPPDLAARHRSPEPAADEQGAHTGGQSVADLLARLQGEPIGGGGRRRRAK